MKAKIINEQTKEVSVALGTNPPKDYVEMDVEQAYTGDWYIKGYAPEPPAPTKDEQSAKRERAYKDEVDGITAHISRLRDAEQTDEILAEIATLIAERDAKVAEIKELYPYPTDPIIEEPEE